MKITVAKKELGRVLDLAAGAVADNALAPALQAILFSTAPDGIRVSATNGESSLLALVEGTVERPGEMLIGARWLRDATRIVDSDVTLDATEARCTVTSGGAVFRVGLLPVAEFPSIDSGRGEESCEIEAGVLATLLRAVAYAADDPKRRPDLAGVCICADGDGLWGVAENGDHVRREHGRTVEVQVEVLCLP